MTEAGDAHWRAVLTHDNVWAGRGQVCYRISGHWKEDLGVHAQWHPEAVGRRCITFCWGTFYPQTLRLSDTPGHSLWLQHLTHFSSGIFTWNCQPSQPRGTAGCKLQSLGLLPHIMVTQGESEASFPGSLKAPSRVGRLGQNDHQSNSLSWVGFFLI